MKVLVVDSDGLYLAFCWRCVQAGHEVKWFVRETGQHSNDAGKGFKGITRVKNWVGEVGWADLIVPTGNNLYLERLQFFKSKGAPVFGPSVASADLEIKRGLGMDFLKQHGIDVPPYKTFKTLKDAEKHVWKTGERFVFKTLGDNEDKSLSYVAKSPASLIEQLRFWQKMGMNPKGEVMLQEFVDGVEFAVSSYIGKEGFVGLPNENFEHKKMMSGNYGPNTGEQGTVMKYTDDSKLFNETLKKLEKPLVEMEHLGDVDINFIVPEDGKPRALEFTCRFGFPAKLIMLVTEKSDPAQWMKDAIEGKDTLKVSQDVAVGVLLTLPPFPNKNVKMDEVNGIPIYGVTKKNAKYIQPVDVQIQTHIDEDGGILVNKNMWATSNCITAVVTGTGRTVKQAAERAYATTKEVSISNMIVRDDIGEKLKESLPKLQKHGYATSFEYEGGKK